MAQCVDQKQFDAHVKSYVEVTSELVGSKIISFSDEWFAEASNLLKPGPAIVEVRFVPSGRWYDGWETRRHNTEPSDWVVVELGVAKSTFAGFEVDTTHFNGNHAPAISVEATYAPGGAGLETAKWTELVSYRECKPTSRHFYILPETKETYTHVRLHMYPDGGIARFRGYGRAVPEFPEDPKAVIDLAAIVNGGVCVGCSDDHFSSADNLLLPGRGTDMSDGWETSRSRAPGHEDWAIIKLGAPGIVDNVVVDSAFFFGNFPQQIRIEALSESDAASANGNVTADTPGWRTLVPNSKTTANSEHVYGQDIIAAYGQSPVAYVKVVMIPDGGLKRVRVFGRRASA